MLLHEYTVMAAAVVEQTFPPRTGNEVERIAASLNLLNAVVKLQEGKELTSYNYIKGMAGCLFVWLLYHPIEGVAVDWNGEEDITYISIGELQFSFHHVPIVKHYVKLRNGEGLTPQQWDGLRHQTIAAELFRRAVGKPLPKIEGERARLLIAEMRHCTVSKIIRRINQLEGVEPVVKENPPQATKESKAAAAQKRMRRRKRMRGMRTFAERHLPDPRHAIGKYGEWKQQAEKWLGTEKEYLFDLSLALKFNGWREEKFELARRGDTHVYRVAAYTGDNYGELVRTLMGQKPLAYIRPEWLMRKGWHYFLRRSSWRWTHMTYMRYLLMVAHNNYLLLDGRRHNLCITYGLARYLSAAYPQLRFVNTLNFTRFKVKRRVYSATDLKSIGIHSKARRLKVWMVVDPLLLLADLDVEALPKELVEEFRETEDYYTFFKKVWHKGKVGLVAYSRFHLLPAIYRQINICGHYAHVRNDYGKWAIYSLMEEEFETGFVFDAIYFDPYLYLLVGCKGPDRVIIHDMFNPV